MESQNQQNIVIKVRPSKEAEFRKLVKKFNRCLKAAKMDEIEPALLGKCSIFIRNATSGVSYCVEGNEYSLSIPESVIKMGEYRFIGEYRKVDGKWMRTMHSKDVKDEMEVRESNMRCDHCGRHISNRNGYFFFRKPTGELTVVGSTCVDAFMGFHVRYLLETLGSAVVFDREPGVVDLEHEVISVDIKCFLRLVYGATDGFRTWIKKGENGATSGRLKSAVASLFFNDGEVHPLPEVQNADELIDKARQYWRVQVCFSDITVNSKKALDGNFVPVGWAGIAGWAMFKPLAVSNGSMQDRGVQQYCAGGYVGKVGEQMTLNLIPRKCIPFQNQYGNAWAIHFDDATGNHYLTFTGNKGVADFAASHINAGVNTQFTVSGQSLDRGRKLNKIKWVKMLVGRT